MVKALTYDIPDYKMKLQTRQFQVMGKNTRQINNTGYKHFVLYWITDDFREARKFSVCRLDL